MDRPLCVAAMAGSNRRESVNRALMERAVEAVGSADVSDVEVEVQTLDLRRYTLPLYDADLQQRDGIPLAAVALHDRIAASDAVLLANPEYNGGYPALFKNALDWVTRVDNLVMHPRYVGLLSATPGRGGGVRGIEQVRTLMENIFVTVHPEAFSLAGAREALTAQGWNDHGDRLAQWAEGFVSAAAAHTDARDDTDADGRR